MPLVVKMYGLCVSVCPGSLLDNGSMDFDNFFKMEATNFPQMDLFQIFAILLFTTFIVKNVNFQCFLKFQISFSRQIGLMDFDNCYFKLKLSRFLRRFFVGFSKFCILLLL